MALDLKDLFKDVKPCDYCANWDPTLPTEHKCLEGVPVWAVSVHCRFWAEERSTDPVPVKLKRPMSIETIKRKYLVDTL